MSLSVSTKTVSALLLLLTCIFSIAGSAATTDSSAKQRGEHDSLTPAIEFDADLPWLNVSRALTLSDLEGKVVILDFWTYGCINCIHVLEDFRKLEQKYGNKLAVIGVHTPKFDNERNLETLRRIVVRYGIEHPVVNDVDLILGKQYGMRAWPTQFVIDPEGFVLGMVEGENHYELFVEVIDSLLEKHATKLNDKPLPISLEKSKLATSLLAAPGKIAVANNRVAISDTLHNRIIIADTTGSILQIIGGTASGFKDGAAAEARFYSPQGLAFSELGLYVADTGNHSIRYIDLQKGLVTTVAGNGKNEIHRGKVFNATEIGLRSPWALTWKEGKLYIAMAGIHQIWMLEPDANRITAWAGSGRESIDDGALSRAGFSQPSGLSLSGDKLFIADAEDSAVRLIDLQEEQVQTLVGTGLFDFGDKDGTFETAQLQHVLGIASIDPKLIYIADTYNHKLKLLDLMKREVTTVAGTGNPGKGTGKALTSALNEPGGLAVLGNRILIADTNNNRIMQYDPAQKTLEEWPLKE